MARRRLYTADHLGRRNERDKTVENFDPYQIWLDIPPSEQPPDYYRLLSVRLFEDDPNTIAEAAVRVSIHVRRFSTGPNANECQKLIDRIAAAKACLLDPARKRQYDAQLRSMPQSPEVLLRPPPPVPGGPSGPSLDAERPVVPAPPPPPGGVVASPAAPTGVEPVIAGPPPPGPPGVRPSPAAPLSPEVPVSSVSGSTPPSGLGVSVGETQVGSPAPPAPVPPIVAPPVTPSVPVAPSAAPMAAPIASVPPAAAYIPPAANPVLPTATAVPPTALPASPAVAPSAGMPAPGQPQQASWVPPERTGTVGKSVSSVIVGKPASPVVRTSRGRQLRREVRAQSGQRLLTVLLAGAALVIGLFLLMAIWLIS